MFDVAAWGCGLLAAVGMTKDLSESQLSLPVLWHAAVAVCALVAVCGVAAGLYRGRYARASFDEVRGVLTACAGVAVGLGLLGPMLVVPQRHPSLEVAVGGGLLAMLLMLGGRHAVVTARLRSRPAAPSATKIIVFGAGDAGEMLIRRLVTEPGAAYRPVALLDDDPDKQALQIHGVRVAGGRARMADVARQTGAQIIVIALAGSRSAVIRELTRKAAECGLTPMVVPSVQELIRGTALIDTVRDPRISDLLGRGPLQTDLAAIASHFTGKRILVTGAGGSIGSELCRHLHRLGPAALILLDRDESALHALELTLHCHGLLTSEETVVADIRDTARMRQLFGRFGPDIVFHAAALKHLPLLERHPVEALLTNVRGSLSVLAAARACGTASFVNISTDKAASPASVLGYSKRIAERLTAYMATGDEARYLSVRFGNVLGSNGSVLSALSAQIAAGGPVTITHPDVSRFFMTADEAVQLVLQAAVIGRPGEALVFDMGEPVRITDMARRLGAGGADGPEIVFTGLRPGEKLTEDLLAAGELDTRPCHPLISQVTVPPLAPAAAMAIDPGQGEDQLRQALAACAGATALGGPAPRVLRPATETAPVPASGLARPRRAVTTNPWCEAGPGPLPGVRKLTAGRSRRVAKPPAQAREPGGQLGQQCRRRRVGRWGAARRVGHVIVRRGAQQCSLLPAVMHPGQPGGQCLLWPARAGPLTPAQQLLQRERHRP
jgi:FlaA1/EpsC-like NDP-sugar epimerase